MKTKSLHKRIVFLFTMGIIFASGLNSLAQTNVYDDIIATSANHTSLKAALEQEGLDIVLQNSSATYTVFAPSNDAFDDLASELGTNIAGLLALPELEDILLYHVLGVTAPSSSLSNGQIVTPINAANTVKLTVTGGGMVYANHAAVEIADLTADNGVVHSIDAVILANETVVDVAIDNGFTTLTTAVVTAELLPALTDPFAELTVFAPTNDAFDNAVAALGIDIGGLLGLSNLGDILTYHVLSSEVEASAINNGDVVNPLSATNTLKLTKTSSGDVFVNQAEVTTADIAAENGIVHVLDAVVLPNETVVDVALDNGFSTLVTAVITAELLPALTDPFAELTVFAPTNGAFDAAVAELGIDIEGLLGLSNLGDILTYHVLGSEVEASAINNGDVVSPLSATNTLKLTKTSMGDVFVNQAQVTSADIAADNGLVHVIDGVVLPNETVVDVALDNGYSSLATAVITAELLPALSDPYSEFTVFAPTNEAFDDLAADLSTDIAGLLALENLGDILLYHVVSGTTLSTELTTGSVTTLNGSAVDVDLSNGVMINQSTVLFADVNADNGVVHVIDKVLVPTPLGTEEVNKEVIGVYPNPAVNELFITSAGNIDFVITDIKGSVVLSGITNNSIDVSSLTNGVYVLNLINDQVINTHKIVKQ